MKNKGWNDRPINWLVDWKKIADYFQCFPWKNVKPGGTLIKNPKQMRRYPCPLCPSYFSYFCPCPFFSLALEPFLFLGGSMLMLANLQHAHTLAL